MDKQTSPLNSEPKAEQRSLLGKNPYMGGGMFEGSTPIIFANAKYLRKNMTDAEKVLWFYLKRGINGLKFRRQHPISIYIADFYCHKVRLIIEVDGLIHEQNNVKEADDTRQKELERWGYTIIRFSNQQVVTDIDNVINCITDKITQLNKLPNNNNSTTSGV